MMRLQTNIRWSDLTKYADTVLEFMMEISILLSKSLNISRQ